MRTNIIEDMNSSMIDKLQKSIDRKERLFQTSSKKNDTNHLMKEMKAKLEKSENAKHCKDANLVDKLKAKVRKLYEQNQLLQESVSLQKQLNDELQTLLQDSELKLEEAEDQLQKLVDQLSNQIQINKELRKQGQPMRSDQVYVPEMRGS